MNRNRGCSSYHAKSVLFHGPCAPVFVLLVSVLLFPPSGRAADLIPLLPKDTLAAVSVTDVSTLAKEWESTPLGQAAKDPRLAAILDPMNEKLAAIPKDLGEKFGFNVETLRKLTTGGAVAFLTLFEWTTSDVYEFDTCFLAEVRPEDHERVRNLIETLLEKTPVDARRSRYTFKDETVYVTQFIQEIEKGIPDYDPRTGKTGVATPKPGSALALVQEIPIVMQYALVGNRLIVCEGRHEPIRRIIAALKDPAESLGQTQGYRRVSNSIAGEANVTAFLAAGRAWSIFADHLKQQDEKKDLSVLGFQDVGALLLRFRLSGEAIAFDAALETPKTPRGIPAMFLQPGGDNTLKTASLCPPNVSSYSSLLYNGDTVWKGVKELMIRFAPQVWGFVNMQISQYNKMLGIDIERGIFGTMGGELAVYRREPPSLRKRFDSLGEFGSMTILLGLRDGKTFRQNHDRILQVLTAEPYQLPVKTTTYLDTDIHRFKQDPADPSPTVPAWTVTDGFLIAGSDSEELPGALRAWAGKADTSLADDPDFKKVVALFPQPGRLSFSYTPSRALPDMFQPILYLLSGWLAEDFDLSDTTMEPDIKEALARHIGSLAGATYVEPQILRTHSRLSRAGN